MKIALLFGCLALVAGRTITLQKTSLTLTEDSEDADELNDILRTVLSYSDVTSGEQYGGIVQDCSKGKCEYCKKMYRHEGCYIATLEKDTIVVTITVDKNPILKTVIKGPNPPAECKPSIPGFPPSVKDVCLQVNDVNLQQASGCVYVSFKVSGRKMTQKFGCFKIPKSDGMTQITETGQLQDEEHGTRAANHEETVLMFERVNTEA
ncbi:uncharacterized protein LOC123551315 [Mercenaria mercenaria]|uniref:uncharacterized protein LOC123551315 n=1 Tax=Mercenaria mercenaria TaxID=6596 RepID=UPI001E1D42B1|nr:uncharacterized protein LOC123551315 [Mercenaria mercenaria]